MKCFLCRKYHTVECTAETKDTIRYGVYAQREDSEPIDPSCFELDVRKLRGMDKDLYYKYLKEAIEEGLLDRGILEKIDIGGSPELDYTSVKLYAADMGKIDFYGRINAIVEDIDKLILGLKPEENDASWFRKLKIEDKTSIVSSILRMLFVFVCIPPMDSRGSSTIYVLDDNVLYDIDEVVLRVVGALVEKGLARRSLEREVEAALHSTTRIASWSQVDPWDRLKLKNGVLDLRELKIIDGTDCCFRYKLNISIKDDDLKEIREGGYRVEDNPIYRYWRSHFDDKNWRYLVSGLGVWLAPHRTKLISFLIGPTDAGKSTLLRNVTKPIEPIVAHVSLRNITSYTFGLEDLIGKHINVYTERGETVLKNLDLINILVGEQDFISVPRKFKPGTVMRSLKTMFFSMNDPPILFEYGGETLKAFLRRLTLIEMRKPEDLKPIPDLTVDPVEAFKFLLWCRWKLEENEWRIEKMEEEEMQDYLVSMANTALRFLESEYVIEDTRGRVKGTDLYDAYVKYCNGKGVTAMSLQNFYTVVATKYTRYEKHGSIWFKGIRLYGER